ncbi:hypothetical protein ROT00_08710 [Agromyces mediolanus]|uniref:hypothetical protein n=1 Tax=Agromyces mediolanus TaxID=41986 RepID=UPI000AEF6F7A
MARRGLVLVPAVLILAGCAPSVDTSAPTGRDSLFAGPEVASARVECLLDRGWDVKLEGTAIVGSIPTEQMAAYQADDLECLEEAGIDPEAPLTDGQYDAIYDWYIEIEECLADAGFPVPERPSRVAFEESYDADPWIPWSVVPELDAQRAEEICPIMLAPTS